MKLVFGTWETSTTSSMWMVAYLSNDGRTAWIPSPNGIDLKEDGIFKAIPKRRLRIIARCDVIKNNPEIARAAYFAREGLDSRSYYPSLTENELNSLWIRSEGYRRPTRFYPYNLNEND